ncbi:MAG TPA: bifunctional hydroxymethylpyrimidine kinase/phosphomethylpyrimidine kinase, partial [Solirubrobacteraceae bacterium]|nr:bifunctional hydroxymethylpyrimidine kinase/phosphomethylpyrimidine kinase [Solirubrobacteraceae bacterium]
MPAIARTPRVLSIAGSDSGGGAGIQADLKAFARCGVHGTSAITAITAQNTLAVSVVYPIPAQIILAQARAVLNDIGVDAVKVGMLATAEIVHAVAQALEELPTGTPVVLDPVMVAESGSRLLDPDAQAALVAEIVPRASVITPNMPEALALAGHAPHTMADRDPDAAEATRAGTAAGSARRAGHPADRPGAGEREADEVRAHALARAVLALGADIVVLTGGHRGEAVDLFLDSDAPERIVRIPGERHPGGAAHGSGCTHSSVLAAQLALGRTPLQAAL